MRELRRQPRMHLNGDIPVVEIEGEWDTWTGKSVAELVSRLAGAGHLEIVLNLTRITHPQHADSNWADALDHMAVNVREHCGRLDVVATVDQLKSFLQRPLQSGLFWATSEEEAIGHIKGLPVVRAGPILTMRFTR